MPSTLVLWCLLSLTLLACVQVPEGACNVSANRVLLEMRQGGVEPEKNLKGEEAVHLRDYLRGLGNSVPRNVDQAIIFVNEDQAMVTFFWHGCFIGDVTGPFAPVDPSARSA
jgi:hypothetical protein